MGASSGPSVLPPATRRSFLCVRSQRGRQGRRRNPVPPGDRRDGSELPAPPHPREGDRDLRAGPRAKRESDEIVADARKKAAEIISTAENEGSEGGQGRRAQIEAEASAEAERVAQRQQAEVSGLEAKIASQRDRAIELVLDAVARV